MSALHPIQSLPAHPRLADGPVIVIALCADWCGTCREFQPVLERIALAHPEMVFAWADIEDDAELVGDIELDSFPTLAIFHHGTPLHFGASLPLEPVVTRLIRSAATTPAGRRGPSRPRCSSSAHAWPAERRCLPQSLAVSRRSG